MAEKKTQLKIRETKENLFNFLKSSFPALFENKTWTDVEEFTVDPLDGSKILIVFNEE